MKDQYFGDICDYGKFALLRFLLEQGVSVAINWYLTPDDGVDGKHIAYLEDAKFWKYDPELYRHLKESVIVKKKRAVSELEEGGLIPDAKFYHEVIEDPRDYSKAERDDVRAQWHRKGIEALSGADLIFLDPDNGFREALPKKIDDAVKFCFAGEVADYYKSGSDVCISCNRGRRTDEQWENAKKQIRNAAPEAEMMGVTFDKEIRRHFIFAIHPERAEKMSRCLDTFLHTNWKCLFTPENLNKS